MVGRGTSCWRSVAFAAALLAICASEAPTARAFWEWDIKEIYSNADGTVQFVELYNLGSPGVPSQHILRTHTLTANSDGVLKTLTLGSNLEPFSGPHHLLLATAGFENLAGGVLADYTPLPANFFNPNATSITFNWAHDFDIVTIAGSQAPKDGLHSLNEANPADTGQVFASGVNSPTNFAGASGSINLGGGAATPGDFDGNGVVNGADLTRWETNFGSTAAPTVAQGNADGDGDVDGVDVLLWQQHVGTTATVTTAGVPEPGALAIVATGGVAVALRRMRSRRLAVCAY